ncbi:DUF6891 domain-containing protein [Streptomyces profundus]|uniref:DUF6891 domain-containing protein n=1 Tax=Streptomyces profundus TaxID=2867410 RepID=UPI001D164A6B|nr:hypothetical protein [Streptomyces sp. MA3_2.13]UED85169.1 hypothetical protein K4G22_13975 [Streptomyces sp. MA3_2.13]
MLGITVLTERQERHVRPSVDELAALVRRVGGAGDRFLVVCRVPDLPESFVQLWHETGADYTLEYRDGGPERHFAVRLDAVERVIEAVVGWARQEPGWDAGLVWEPVGLPVPQPPPPLELAEKDEKALLERMRELLVGGYATRAELVEAAEEFLVTAERRPVSREQARQLVDRMWLERVAEQAAWVGETDPERITRAFDALSEAGITAREHFTCCRGCGVAEIGGAGEPDARGFVFFHHQSTDSAAAGYGLTLHYGGFDGAEETTVAVGREVVAALGELGLSTDWNGDPGRAIAVPSLDWRRRLVG